MRVFRFRDFEPASLFLKDHPEERKKLMKTPLYLCPFSLSMESQDLKTLFTNMKVRLVQEGAFLEAPKRVSDGFLSDPDHPQRKRSYIAFSINGLDTRSIQPFLDDPCCQEIWILAQKPGKIGKSDRKSHWKWNLPARKAI